MCEADRASNGAWRKDGVLTGYDELYSYDGLYRLTDQKRGTQTAITSGTFEQQWGLDPTGNWKTFKQDNDGNGTWELNQTRVANKVNEITGITNSVGTAWATPTYDGAGNMIGIPNAGTTVVGAARGWVPLTQPCDFGFTLLEIHGHHPPAGSHKLIDLILNFTRLGFQPLIFCVHP